MKRTLIALTLACSTQAQIFTLPTVVTTPDGVVAGFNSAQIEWWGPNMQAMVCKVDGPYGFSGPITATKVTDKDGATVALWNWYAGVTAITGIPTPDTYNWHYITAGYPQGEVTVSYNHPQPSVPEPQTYAMLAGIALCAFAAVRRLRA